MADDDEDHGGGGDDNAATASKAAGMVLWTKRMAFFLGFCAFIVMFLLSFDYENYAATRTIVISVVKGLCAGLLFWMGGLIIGNILLKGLITDVPVDQSHLVEGGLLQRIYLYQQRLNYDMEDGNVIQIDPRNDMIVKTKPKPKESGKESGKENVERLPAGHEQ